MIGWAYISLILAIVFWVLGYSGIAGAFAWISFILFVVFLLLAVIGMILYWKPSRRI